MVNVGYETSLKINIMGAAKYRYLIYNETKSICIHTSIKYITIVNFWCHVQAYK